MAHDPIEHVVDRTHITPFESFPSLSIHLPGFGDFQLSLYMLIELVAAGLILAIFIPIGRRAVTGEPPRGTFWNFFETLIVYIRDEVAKPSLGEKDTDRFIPFLWTLFLFILFCNILGLLPYLGSPTANLSVTGVLALIAFMVIHIAGIIRNGPVHYAQSFIPPVDLGNPIANWTIGLVLKAFLFVLELISAAIRGVVLAVRLFANMVAGHLVLAVILGFIALAGHPENSALIFGGVTTVSVVMVLALSILELFVGFLQAFVFTLLTTLFLGMALHPEH